MRRVYRAGRVRVPGSIEFDAADLAPGDVWAAGYDWSSHVVHRVRSDDVHLLSHAYEILWSEFGSRNEMERRAVIDSRLEWDPAKPIGGHALLYELVVVESAGRIIAARDHTAILSIDSPEAGAIVHLSHAFVTPSERGTGLAPWLRAFPLQAARECAARAGVPAPDRITLVAEMEPPDPGHPARMARLKSYERAGFKKVDPGTARYLQPDFRGPEAIDASSIEPVSLALIVRRVGMESDESLSGAEVRSIVTALYGMYGVHQREQDMKPIWKSFEDLPKGDDRVRLLPPTR